MNFISRIPLYSSSLLRINNGVANTVQKLSLIETYHSKHPKVNMITEGNGSNKGKMLTTDKANIDITRYIKQRTPTKLHRVNLALIVKHAEKIPKGLLVATFQKLCFIYHQNKHKPSFHKEVNFLSRSKVFYEFCQILEKNLIKFEPSYLIDLLDLIHFNVPVKSAIMRKIFVLILDNTHHFPAVDLLQLYCQLQEEHFRDNPQCKSILQACENYFDKHLDEELSHYYNLRALTYFISEKNLPLKFRKIITEKCLNLIELNHYNLTHIPIFFLSCFEEPILSFYKTELLEKFKLLLAIHRLPKSQDIFSHLYKKSVHKYDVLYDEEICKMLIDNLGFLFSDKSFIKVISHLCEIGYYDQRSVEKALDFLITLNLNNFPPMCVFHLVSIFVDTSSQEMNNPHWSKIKSQLESFDAMRKFTQLPLLLEWCEFLTFLGCDTTSLFSQIFDTAHNITETKNSRKLLRLHHVCKKYFPESGLELSESLVASCLEKSVYERDFYVQSHVHKFFGGQNYVVENCVSTDSHFWPMVAVLGPDNKPIDLSIYKPEGLKERGTEQINVTVNIDRIEKPAGSKVIAFVEYPSPRPFRFRNAPMVSGFLQMFLKPYEEVNCNIVPLPERYFFFKDDEKSKYLSTEINKIIESSDATSIRNKV